VTNAKNYDIFEKSYKKTTALSFQFITKGINNSIAGIGVPNTTIQESTAMKATNIQP